MLGAGKRRAGALLVVMLLLAQFSVSIPARAANMPPEGSSVSRTGGNGWSNSPNEYHPELAASAAFYLTEAADPAALEEQLQGDGFHQAEAFNYDASDGNTVALVIAAKTVNYFGQPRTLLVAVCRGTGSLAEWQGNMDVTGPSYDPTQLVHTSFSNAAENLRETMVDYMGRHGISEPLLFLTGHSRGAAAANILADRIASGSAPGLENCTTLAYTFATPNVTRARLADRPNIFNFCFDDDIITRMPLEKWGYNKPGRTCTAVAGTSTQAADDFIAMIENLWPSLSDYYNKRWFCRYDWKDRRVVRYRDETLYRFCRDRLAASGFAGAPSSSPRASEKGGSLIYDSIIGLLNSSLLLDQQMEATHSIETYYDALLNGSFTVPD